MRRLLFAFATVFVGSGCMCVGCMCPGRITEYHQAELAHRQTKAEPVIDALEAYKAKHGAYPEKLDELVAERLLDAIPDLAVDEDHRGEAGRVERARPLAYSRDGDGYRLWVEFTFIYNHPLGLAARERRAEYRSADRKWSLASPSGERPRTSPPTKK